MERPKKGLSGVGRQLQTHKILFLALNGIRNIVKFNMFASFSFCIYVKVVLLLYCCFASKVNI